MDKAAFKKRFLKLFSPRLHMTLIMTATILSGLVISHALLWTGLRNMTMRYPLVLLAAYGCFFLLLRLYLVYLTHPFAQAAPRKSSGSGIDVVGIDSSGFGGGSTGGSGPSFFQGGSTGGGGASGSWDVDGPDPATPLAAVVSSSGDGGGKAASGLLDGAGDALGDSDSWVLIVIGLVVVAIFGSSIILIYQAPAILSEAAFQLLLAGGLAKTTRQAATADWAGSVFKATWKPFAVVLILTVILGAVLHRFCPKAGKIAEVFKMCL